jgi:hypothetical protein
MITTLNHAREKFLPFVCVETTQRDAHQNGIGTLQHNHYDENQNR